MCNGAINISTLVVKVVNWQYLVIYLQKISKNKGHFKTLNKCGCNYIFKILSPFSNNQIVQYNMTSDPWIRSCASMMHSALMHSALGTLKMYVFHNK